MTFTGLVRSDARDPITSLTLECYPELAIAQIGGLEAQAVARFGLIRATVIHRYGELRPGERADRFFERWTLKEAYVKARGLGLSLPLAQIGFDLTPLAGARAAGFLAEASARLVLGPGCPDDGRRYWLKAWRVSREHRAAVGLAQPPYAAHVPDAATGAWPIVCLRADVRPSLVSPPPSQG